MILGTDGLFDFVPNQVAVDMCLSERYGRCLGLPFLLSYRSIKVADDDGSHVCPMPLITRDWCCMLTLSSVLKCN